MPHKALIFIPFLPFFISFFIKSYGTDLPAYCSTWKCGGLEVKYPFWLQSNSTAAEYCGYRGFGLECISSSTSGSDDLVLRLPSEEFYVKNINYTARTLTLVDINVTTNLTCPRARHNLTLEGLPLKFSMQDLNLTFYFNCTGSLASAYAVDCLRSGNSMSYVSLEANDLDWFEFCEEKVVSTVIKREINGSDNTWASAMNDGFVLDWHNTTVCSVCESSEGHCGYNDLSQQFLCLCNDGTKSFDHCKGPRQGGDNDGRIGKLEGKNRQLKLSSKIIGVSAGIGLLIICVICYYRNNYPKEHTLFSCIRKSKDCQNLEAFVTEFGSLAPRRYTYKEIRKMTNSFKDKIGKGGYGDVYRGNHFDNRPVAVKILNTFKGSGEEFINEVASISKTSHVNIVTLLGFCLDGHRRALIYEFMPNGSLEKYIYGGQVSNSNGGHLGWVKVYEIAIGIARGLDYLHKGCNTRILHFDIKPHNILLDEYFHPKISDFGLAKLCAREEIVVSITGARGTIGYIAPELVCRNFGGVSHKSDVFSYGMMLLEMVGGRHNFNNGVSHTSEIYFPHWAYQRLVLEEDLKLQEVMTQEENEFARKMILVALWCIQTNPSQRPAMTKVIEMLEDDLQALEIPPKPFFDSPSRSEIKSSTTVVELP